MLFKDIDKSVSYLTKTQIIKYTQVLLKRYVGYDFEVFVETKGYTNSLIVSIDEGICSEEAWTAYTAFMNEQEVQSLNSMFYALLEKKYNTDRYRYTFKHLVEGTEGVYIIRFRENVKPKSSQPTKKIARPLIKNTNHLAQYDWGDISIQGGENGLVCAGRESYRTAFVEAFPRDPRTFIRGEGKTIREAETNAWNQYHKILSCEQHEFERRGYRNGLGICKHCDYAKKDTFDPLETCNTCGVATYFCVDADNNFYCEDHTSDIPKEKRLDFGFFED